MSEMSIIIDGVRYDAVRTNIRDNECESCDLKDLCDELEKHCMGGLSDVCANVVGSHSHFKKSIKSFEP